MAPHNCGVYAQRIARDPLTDLAAIPYKEAEKAGYDKLDLLHLSVYDIFESRDEIEALLEIEPNWQLLTIPSVVSELFQLAKHLDILLELKPKSIEDLADAIALIRPGKRSLLPFYLADRENARRLLYSKDSTGFAFKKSHAYAYAMVVVLQLHIAG